MVNGSSGMDDRKPNRLAGSTSPYLLQHQWNPVDWYPWGEEAIAKSRSEDKPIFLSIGYSACHWCHVMERESFEDPQIAELLYASFVAIKVDREQRPDLDQIYMQSVQMMTGAGGWPMSVFLTPKLLPFYCGTYWPPMPRWGKPSFRQVIHAVADAWKKKRISLEEQAMLIVQNLNRTVDDEFDSEDHRQTFRQEELLQAASHICLSWDADYGGFGEAPKFPSPTILSFLMRMEDRQPEQLRREVILRTLDAMAAGGIFDHLAGGFARYSVDRRWLIPHFEKMLCDNGLLVKLYADAFAWTGDEHYQDIAERTIDYLLTTMQHEESGFFSAEDADSDGVEGKYYVWNWQEVQQVLELEEAELFCEVYDIRREGNFEGQNVVNLIVAPGGSETKIERIARERSMEIAMLDRRLKSMRDRLLQVRNQRVRPALDDKILLSWNALVIEGLCAAGCSFDRSDYIAQAEDCGRFLKRCLRSERGRWLHVWREGQGEIEAFLDDLSYLGNAFLTLFECTGRLDWLEFSHAMGEQILAEFSAGSRRGFYFVGSRSEPLIARLTESLDHSLPASGSMAAYLMARLSHIFCDPKWEMAARDATFALREWMTKAPNAIGQGLIAIDELFGPTEQWVLVTEGPIESVGSILRKIKRTWSPRRSVFPWQAGQGDRGIPLQPVLAGRTELPSCDGALYVCLDNRCLAPILGLEGISRFVDGMDRKGSVKGHGMGES